MRWSSKIIMNNLRLDSKVDNFKYLFNISYFLAYFSSVLPLTILVNFIPNKIFLIMKIFSVIIISIKIIADTKFTIKGVLFLLPTLIILAINFLIIKEIDILLLLMLMLGSANVKVKQIVKHTLILNLLLMITLFFSSNLDIVENFKYARTVNGVTKIRNSFGTIYPNVFGSIIFFMLLQYTYLKSKLDVKLGLLSAAMGIYIFIYTDNRLVFFLMSLFSVLSISQVRKWKFLYKKINIIMIASIFIILPIVFLLLCKFYNYDSVFFVNLNNIFSNRLYLSWQAFQKYSLSFFAQFIQMNGFGNNSTLNYGESYFYLDSLPILLIIKYGVFVFILYILYCFFCIFITLKNKNIVLNIILVLIILYDLVDNKSINIALNPFPIILFNNYIFGQYSYRDI